MSMKAFNKKDVGRAYPYFVGIRVGIEPVPEVHLAAGALPDRRRHAKSDKALVAYIQYLPQDWRTPWVAA